MLNRLIKILAVIRLARSAWWDVRWFGDAVIGRLFDFFALAVVAWAFVVIFL